MVDVRIFPCLSDNYGMLVRDPSTGATAAIDAPDGDAVLAAARRIGWTISQIWVTHHHPDHVQGVPTIKAATECLVVGPQGEASKIPGLDRMVGEGDRVPLGAQDARVIETPGHTLGHIAYALEDSHVAFVGDTLFAMGCGRLFEGTADQMWTSLKKLRDLAPETQIYCAHEYTAKNLEFALSLEPDHPMLKRRAEKVHTLRSEGRPTVPTTLAAERATNPFLRADDPSFAGVLGLTAADPVAVFAETRARRDRF